MVTYIDFRSWRTLRSGQDLFFSKDMTGTTYTHMAKIMKLAANSSAGSSVVFVLVLASGPVGNPVGDLIARDHKDDQTWWLNLASNLLGGEGRDPLKRSTRCENIRLQQYVDHATARPKLVGPIEISSWPRISF